MFREFALKVKKIYAMSLATCCRQKIKKLVVNQSKFENKF